MVTFEISDGILHLHVMGMDRLWSFKSQLSIPIAHIVDAAPATDEAKHWYHGIRAPGTNIPGVITAGTFYDDEGCVYWDVQNPANAIAIALHDERYSKIVIEVNDPAATIEQVRSALAEARSNSTSA
jgi:hypothetical protein